MFPPIFAAVTLILTMSILPFLDQKIIICAIKILAKILLLYSLNLIILIFSKI